MRKLRHLIGASMGSLSVVEITARTAQEQFLLRPDPEASGIIAGVLARAANRYGVALYGHTVPSNHFHVLIGVRSARQMKQFMNYFMGNCARKINILRKRSGPFWHRRYTHIEVAPDEESLVARLDYLLQHGVKEGLVRSPLDWPGLHCAHQLASSDWTVRGHWDDLTKKFRLEQAGKTVQDAEIRTEETVELQPLPCWEDKPREWIVQWVRERIAQIVEMFADKKPVGANRVVSQPWSTSPRRSKRTYATQFHCKDPTMRHEWRLLYRQFVRAFRLAAGALAVAGDEFGFPAGAFPPAAEFIDAF